METITLAELLRLTKLTDQSQVDDFHALRVEAFQIAWDVYEDRATSYNSDHEPVEEMVFGPLSLVSELHKRTIRMCGLLSPMKPELRRQDLNRLVDLSVDVLNYSSWLYAIIRQAIEAGNELCDDAPDYNDVTTKIKKGEIENVPNVNRASAELGPD